MIIHSSTNTQKTHTHTHSLSFSLFLPLALLPSLLTTKAQHTNTLPSAPLSVTYAKTPATAKPIGIVVPASHTAVKQTHDCGCRTDRGRPAPPTLQQQHQPLTRYRRLWPLNAHIYCICRQIRGSLMRTTAQRMHV